MSTTAFVLTISVGVAGFAAGFFFGWELGFRDGTGRLWKWLGKDKRSGR